VAGNTCVAGTGCVGAGWVGARPGPGESVTRAAPDAVVGAGAVAACVIGPTLGRPDGETEGRCVALVAVAAG
jgi:hypothetical protein